MRVGFDLSAARTNQAGTGRYVACLAEALQSLAGGDICFLSLPNTRVTGSRKTAGSRLNTLYRDLIWMHLELPRRARQERVDVLHLPASLSPLRAPCPVVLTIHDTISLQSPRDFPVWHRLRYRVFLPLSARRARQIIAVSEFSKRDIVRDLKVDPARVTVVYEAASPAFRVLTEAERAAARAAFGLDRFVLAVGTLEPRKNWPRLLQAIDLLRQRGQAVKLVHAGPRGWHDAPILDEASRLELGDLARFIGHIPLEDLVRLYNIADLMVYPSLHEGFGLPILEAMACGCPVVTSNRSAMPEIAGGAAVLIDPTDPAAIADAIQAVITEPSLARSLSEKGLSRSRSFSWARCARETWAVYRQACQPPSP